MTEWAVDAIIKFLKDECSAKQESNKYRHILMTKGDLIIGVVGRNSILVFNIPRGRDLNLMILLVDEMQLLSEACEEISYADPECFSKLRAFYE